MNYDKVSHIHCFDQINPPCGKKSHTQCCLCEKKKDCWCKCDEPCECPCHKPQAGEKCDATTIIEGQYSRCQRCGGNNDVSTNHICLPESPTPHATDWEREFEKRFSIGADEESRPFWEFCWKSHKGEQLNCEHGTRCWHDDYHICEHRLGDIKSFIRTTVDEAVRKERERTAKGIIKQIEILDLTGVNQVISLIHQIDKWMPSSAK